MGVVGQGVAKPQQQQTSYVFVTILTCNYYLISPALVIRIEGNGTYTRLERGSWSVFENNKTGDPPRPTSD